MRAAALAAIVAAACIDAGGGAAASSPVRVSATELQLSQPVTALAADGSRVAFVFCGQLVGVWKPSATTVSVLNGFPGSGTDCPTSPALRQPPVGSVAAVALAGTNLAWILSTGGNLVENMLGLASVTEPADAALVAGTSHIRDDPTGPQNDRFSGLLGHGRLLLFASRLECGDPGAPVCPAGTTTPTLVSQTLWRVRPGGTSADCAGQSCPCASLATASGRLVPLATDGTLVALADAGALAVVAPSGKTRHTFPTLATATGATLIPGAVVADVSGRLLELSLANGKLLHSWRLGGGSSATLLDAGRKLVAYLSGPRLHLLRLRDGRDRVVAAADVARFSARGLFYARSGRIVFVPWRALPLEPEP